MEPWLSWVIGFGIWFFVVIMIFFVTYLLTGFNLFLKVQAGKVPDRALDYYYRPDFIPKEAYLIDMHTHTLASDGWMSPEQLIKWEKANGFNAFVLTDHNTGQNNQPIMDLQVKYPDILIIPGYEWTAARIHLNIIDIQEFPKPTSHNPSDQEIQEVIRKSHQKGAVIQCNHITWTVDQPYHRSGLFTHPSREDLLAWDIDGFEINNEMRWYDPKTVHWLDQKKKLGELPKPIFTSTGTDIHNPLKEWATGWTELLLTDEERQKTTIDVIKKALVEGRTKIWVDHDYREPHEAALLGENLTHWKKLVLAPFFGLSHGLIHLPGNIKGVISYLIWFLLAYFPLRILFMALLTF